MVYGTVEVDKCPIWKVRRKQGNRLFPARWELRSTLRVRKYARKENGRERMANQDHLDILKQGNVWNKWRREHPEIQPDLSGVDLSREDFSGIDLSRSGLQLTRLFLSNLSSADLSGADLYGTDFSGAILREANLSRTNIYGTDFSGADLTATDFSNAKVELAIFGYVDLSLVKGLETMYHTGPSVIGIDTIYHSQGNIPEAFLKGAGVDDTFITYIHSLIGKPIQYYSCFISYSSKDDAFAKRLYADLQSHNIRCWFAPEDLKWGERIRTGIDEAIHMHDKLLLILSKHSVASGWVEREVKTALTKEKKEKRTVLFPVRVDGAVFDSPFEWATEIRHERNIGDFTRWKQHEAYQRAFDRLLRDLKAEAQKMGLRDATTNAR